MTGPVKNRSGRRPLLRPDHETLELVRQFARQGVTKRATARAFGVCDEAFSKFLERSAKARAIWEEGQATAKRLRIEAAARSLVTAEPPAEPSPGETCPTCGQLVGGPDLVSLTQSEIAHAAREFDAILDRHLATRAAGGNAD